MTPDEIWKIAKKILKYTAIAVAGLIFLFFFFEGVDSRTWSTFAPIAFFTWWIGSILVRIESQLSRIAAQLQNNAEELSRLRSDCSDIAYDIRAIKADTVRRY